MFRFLQRDYVLSRTIIYCSKRYAYIITHQHEKCTRHWTQGNHVFVGWGDPSYLFLGLFSFSYTSGSFVQPVYYTAQMQTSLNSFFQVTAWNCWEEEDREKLDKHNKQKVQFQRLLEVAWRRRKNFPPRIEKSILLAVARWV